MHKGTLWVDERLFYITGIRLEKGSLVFTARGLGPITKTRRQIINFSIHAPDGTLVSVGRTTITWPSVDEGEPLTLEFPIKQLSSTPTGPWAEPDT